MSQVTSIPALEKISPLLATLKTVVSSQVPERFEAQTEAAFRAYARGESGSQLKVFTRLSAAELAERYGRETQRVVNDLDGTLVREGTSVLAPGNYEAAKLLVSAGFDFVMGPTGKPVAEVAPLLDSHKHDWPATYIIEKGAFLYVLQADGSGLKVPLLTDDKMIAAIGQFREAFYPDGSGSKIGDLLEKEFGIVIVPAGSGKHESVISFDVLKSGSSRDFQSFTHDLRKQLKVNDSAMLDRVTKRFEELVVGCGIDGLDGAKVVHLGNGNIELAPKTVEKDLAVIGALKQHPVDHVTVCGDSKNDRPMLQLSRDQPDQVSSVLVLYREASLGLRGLADNLVIGEANAAPMFKVMEAFRSISRGVAKEIGPDTEISAHTYSKIKANAYRREYLSQMIKPLGMLMEAKGLTRSFAEKIAELYKAEANSTGSNLKEMRQQRMKTAQRFAELAKSCP